MEPQKKSKLKNQIVKRVEMKIFYRPHLKIRLKQRKIPFDYPKQIIELPDQEYFDTLAKRNIAIKKLFFEEKMRNMVIAL